MEFDKEYFQPYWDDYRRLVSYKKEIAWIEKHAAGVDHVLDFGCGLGFMTKELLKLGYNVTSCDVSSYAIDFCKTNINPDSFVVQSSTLQELKAAVFDLVILRGVFQHLPSPTDLLVNLNRSVRKGGYVAILATPNIESKLFRASGKLPTLSWEIVRNLPSLSSIRHALEFADFQVIKVQQPYLSSGYQAPVRDMLKFLGNLIGLEVGVGAFPGNVLNVLARKNL